MPEKVIIIGGGIAGLSTGCYLQMNGFETEIHELHNLPGGLCTSWTRNGFNIDGCIHWLVGSKPGPGLYDAWNELIDMKQLNIYDHEIFYRFEDENGKCIRFFNDIDKLEKELLEKAPEDKVVISDYISAARRFSRMKLPMGKPRELFSLSDGFDAMIKMGPYLRLLNKWSKVSIVDFAARCKNPLLRKTMENLFVPEMGIVFVMITTAWMHNKTAGYPIGGSLAFSQLIEKRYLGLGGKIHYNSRIKEINTRKDVSSMVACGVTSAEGKVYKSDYVVSAADGYTTIYHMLEGKFIDKKTDAFYRKGLTFSSYLQLSLGVDRIIGSEASSLIFPLSNPVTIDPGNTISDISIRIHSFDPTLAPEGKTLLTALIPTREDEYWINLRMNDFKKYKAEKERIIHEITEGMENRLGSLMSHLEMKDLSTPATVVRYTNNWKGSFEGWIMTPEIGFSQLPFTLPGLRNFYMAGQWVSPGGGLPSALISGRGVAGLICKRTGRKFTVLSFSS
ncbi:MAG: NAD(P)/FAD-dependent oxidoreductase [Bacteroidales bacterium]|nr:NAD(P)/FAD-dependent oxidoreductase [Bacteroidales bacterium]